MLLDVQGLAKKYGQRQVVNDVSFHVNPGEVVGLLGPNGAGKTTSFRMTCGMVRPDRGAVLLDGRDVTHWPMHRRAREGGLGYLPQQSSVFGKLTVVQNLTATMQLIGMNAKQRREETERLLEEFELTKVRDTASRLVSGGERRKVEIARCLIARPKVVMFDEPFAGVDPVKVQGLQAIIKRLAERGLGVLITDHAALAILQISERVYVIDDGNVLCCGSPAEVAQHAEVRKKYLGDNTRFEPAVAGDSRPPSQASSQASSWGREQPASSSVPSRTPRSHAQWPGHPSDLGSFAAEDHDLVAVKSKANDVADAPVSSQENEGSRHIFTFQPHAEEPTAKVTAFSFDPPSRDGHGTQSSGGRDGDVVFTRSQSPLAPERSFPSASVLDDETPVAPSGVPGEVTTWTFQPWSLPSLGAEPSGANQQPRSDGASLEFPARKQSRSAESRGQHHGGFTGPVDSSIAGLDDDLTFPQPRTVRQE